MLRTWLREGGDPELLVRNKVDAEIVGLFEDLALDLEPSWGGRNASKGVGRDENRQLYEHVKRWMGEVLMPVL
jgi:hypothetical protein